MITLLEFLQKKHIEADYDYVDLGLPSRTLWCECNLGAKHPEDIGDYYAWGETKPVEEIGKSYTYHKYKLQNQHIIIKYNRDDNKSILDFEDDAAYIKSKGEMRLPNTSEVEELSYHTTRSIVNNVIILTSKINNKQLILPTSGMISFNNISSTGMASPHKSENVNAAMFWINETGTQIKALAKCFRSDKLNGPFGTIDRRNFLNIRPVKV